VISVLPLITNQAPTPVARSFSEATANAVAKANETLRNISWFEVVELRGSVVEEKIHQYQVTVSIGFRVE